MRTARSRLRTLAWISGLTMVGLAFSACSGAEEGPSGNAAGGAGTGGGQNTAGSGGSAGSSWSGPGGGTSSSGAAGGGQAGTAGSPASGGSGSGGGGAAGTGGTAGTDGGAASGAAGSSGAAGTGASGGGTGGGAGGGTCTASKAANARPSGSGTHQVVVETNADPGIKEGTIFRPSDLGPGKKYPIFVWGNGACSKNGLSNQAAMAEIASHGYFVVADGTPNGSGGREQTGNVVQMAKPLIAYIDWAIAENGKACSAYYQSLDTTKVAANGFSCGGLMSSGTAGDARITTWGITSSGTLSANQAFYETVHTPVLIIEGGTSDIAYENGARDYENISKLDVPLMWFSKNIGHGGDLGASRGGDFAKISLAWLNWWLKGDQGATGKGVLVGAGCRYCTDSAWDVKSAHLP